MRVLIFGDSITQGFWDTQGGWADRLKRTYAKTFVETQNLAIPTIFNLGISGDTTAGLLNRIEAEIEARKFPGEELAFIFAIGINDTIYRDKNYDSEPELYDQELVNLMAKARVYADKMLFVGLTPVVDKMLQPMAWSTTGKCYSSMRIRRFNDILKEVCAREKVPYVELFEQFEKVGPQSILEDGLHPNDEGHTLIYRSVRREFEKLLT